jgi:hypothetical protein
MTNTVEVFLPDTETQQYIIGLEMAMYPCTNQVTQILRPVMVAALAVSTVVGSRALAEVPGTIAAPGAIRIALVHAQGAQVYECKSGATGQLAWQFREPIAALFEEGRTVGRHYAGPSWELDDGSRVTAKVASRAPGATAKDIPMLKLEVATNSGAGRLREAVAIQRLNTKGGVAEGWCARPGDLLSVPYAADYAILKRAD